jgi:copper chaperone CopZ
MDAKQTGIVAAVLGSICCAGPLLLLAIGVGSGAVFIGRYHWFFIIGAIGILAWAWTKYLREKTICDREQRPMQGPRRALLALLISTLFVFGFAGLNVGRYVFASAPVAGQTQLADGLNRVIISVDGLSCVACEIPVRHALRKIDGVKSVQVNAGTKTATVDYEASKTNPDQLVAAISSTGYRASLPNK